MMGREPRKTASAADLSSLTCHGNTKHGHGASEEGGHYHTPLSSLSPTLPVLCSGQRGRREDWAHGALRRPGKSLDAGRAPAWLGAAPWPCGGV